MCKHSCVIIMKKVKKKPTISSYLGTPWVIFIDATPAKWKVFNVICVPGSPILWAAIAPTGVPVKTKLIC